MVLEQRAVRVSGLAEEPRRAFDIREQEGDGTGGELCHVSSANPLRLQSATR